MSQFRPRQSGNILIYILVAIMLLSALTFALTRQGDDGSASRLTDDRANLKASELINYVSSLKSAVEQMHTLGNVTASEMNFAQPGEAGYGSGNTSHQVFHSAGGGMTPFVASEEMFQPGSSNKGWVKMTGQNVAWTASSQPDAVFSFADINPAICAAINTRLYRDATIPVLTVPYANVFDATGGSPEDLTATNCPGCDGRLSLCVQDSLGVDVFYNVVLGK